MSTTRWPRIEATILRHLARRQTPTATADAIAAATGLSPDDVTYALEALYEAGQVDTALDSGTAVRRWRLAGREAEDGGGGGGPDGC